MRYNRRFPTLHGARISLAIGLGALGKPVEGLLVPFDEPRLVVVIVGGYLTIRNAITVGDIQAFIAYVTFMLWPVQEMARVYAQMQQSIASGERAFAGVNAYIMRKVMALAAAKNAAQYAGGVANLQFSRHCDSSREC